MKKAFVAALVLGLFLTGPVSAGADKETRQTMCPVMNWKINEDVYVMHEGKKVYLCCTNCIEKFNAEPDKYMQILEGQK